MMGFLPDGWLPRRSPADPGIVPGDSPQPPEHPMDAQSAHWAVWHRDGDLRAVWYYDAPRAFHQVVDELDPDGRLSVGTDHGDRLEPVSEARARELSTRAAGGPVRESLPDLERVRAARAEYLRCTVLPEAPPPSTDDINRSGDVLAAMTVYNTDAVFAPAAPPEQDPGAANRRPDFPEPPDYSRRAHGAVARIDAALDENLRAANQRLRADLRDEIDRRRVAELERDTALARVAELELTLKALGRFVVHAAQHDAEGGA